MSDKPFSPTARRRARAHRKGDVPRSSSLTAAIALALLTISIPPSVGVARALVDDGLRAIAADAPLDPRLALRAIGLISSLSAIVAVAPFVASAIVGGVSFGGVVDASASPSPPRAWSIARGVTVASIAIAIVAFVVVRLAPRLAWRLGDPARSISYGCHAILGVAAFLVVVLAIVGVVEAAIARSAWTERWSMSRAEARDDARASHGDPVVGARVRARTREAGERIDATFRA